jgi:hypothetical protein
MGLSQEKEVSTPKTNNWLLMFNSGLWVREHLCLLCDCVFLLVLFFDHCVVKGVLHVALAHSLLTGRSVLALVRVLEDRRKL